MTEATTTSGKYQVLPDLTPLEYAALKADIAERGILVPVEVDENGDMLDGHHRARAWTELRDEGVELPAYATLVRAGLTEEEKRNHARSLNLLRRQLTNEQRDQVMRDQRADGMGYQEIADTAGVSVWTAWDVAHDVELLDSKKLPGKDGKVYPATYAPRLKSIFIPGETTQLRFEDAREVVTEHYAQQTEIRRDERKARQVELTHEPTPFPELPHKFDLLYADPPWRYDFSPTDSRAIENQYQTMDIDALCGMPIPDIVIANAVLFLWSPFPKLEEALRVINAWGFRFRTGIVWDKVRMGMGIYVRQQVELLLIATQGEMYAPEEKFAANQRSLVSIERTQFHSEKPDEFYDILEGLYPDATKLELFARKQRDGWTAWGNQA